MNTLPLSSEYYLGMALSFLIGLLFFLVIRRIVCWYFKLNEISAHLKDIKVLLENRKTGSDPEAD